MAKEHPRYAEMEWPDNGFQEYPKMVYPTGDTAPTKSASQVERVKPGDAAKEPGQGVLVNNADEERVVMSGKAIVREADEVEDLRQKAALLSIPVDKRWGAAKLQEKIDEAEAALNE